jgi:glycosyltransferase involved in cell wall biosynthesis
MTRRDQLRITLVEFSPSGGLYQFAVQLGAGLGALGHRVELVTGPAPEFVPDQSGFTVLPILPTWHPAGEPTPTWRHKFRRAGRAGRYVAAWGVVARHLRRARPDVVQWAEWRFAVDGFVAAWLARRSWAKVMVDLVHTPVPLVEQDGQQALHKSGRLLWRGLGVAYRQMDGIVVLGQQSKQEMFAHWPDVGRVEVLPHGDEGLYASSSSLVPADSTPPRLLFFGTWTRYKGIEELLDAFAIVRRDRPAAQLLVAGPVSADVDVSMIARRAEAIGGVELRPGYVAISDVPDLVQSARAVVAPYRCANASGVVHLAMSLGRPVIVTDVGDLAETVTHGISGLVVPSGSTQALASACSKLLDDPARAGRMGSAGLEVMERTASWKGVASKFAEFYRELLSGSDTRPAMVPDDPD